MKIVIIIIIMKIGNMNCICNFREHIEFRHGVYRFNPLLFTNSVKSEVLSGNILRLRIHRACKMSICHFLDFLHIRDYKIN